MSDRVRILLVGDLALGGETAELVARGEATWTSPFDEVLQLFRSADIRIANLESPLYRSLSPHRKCNLLHAPAEAMEALTGLDMTAVNLANNHITDQATEGLERTRALLSANGIHAFGAGSTLDEASQWPRVSVNDQSFAFLGYAVVGDDVGAIPASTDCGGCVPFAIDRVERDLAAARDRGDHAIVSIHWGYQYDHFPSPDQITLARRLVDAGAIIVHGHHSHVLQGFERYGRGLILYSLGNFFFPDFLRSDGVRFRFPRVAKRTAAALCSVGPEGVESTDFVPLLAGSARRVDRLQGRRAATACRAHDARSRILLQPGYDSLWQKHHEKTVRGRARQELQLSLAVRRCRLRDRLLSQGGGRALFRIRPRHVSEALRLFAGHARLWTRPGDLR